MNSPYSLVEVVAFVVIVEVKVVKVVAVAPLVVVVIHPDLKHYRDDKRKTLRLKEYLWSTHTNQHSLTSPAFS